MQILKDLILSHIHQVKFNKGWHTVRCPLCHDYKDRGGWQFNDDHIIYSCFNCSKKGIYNEGDTALTKSFRNILLAFNIPADELERLEGKLFFENYDKQENHNPKEIVYNFITPEIKFPESTKPLKHCSQEEKRAYVDYIHTRGLKETDVNWHVSFDDKYKDYLLIPFYRDGKLIYWQGRSISGNKKRYENPSVIRDAIIYGYNVLHSKQKLVFVTEGVFDCIPIKGIALLGSVLPPIKVELLRKYDKDFVFVIDKDKNGKLLAKKVLECGWKITHVSTSQSDVSECVARYGRIWTLMHLIENIKTGADAEVWIRTIKGKNEQPKTKITS